MSCKFLLLDSRDQVDPNSSSSDCYFNFRFGGIYNAKSIELLSFSCPMTFYNINANNNKLYFNDGSAKVITITPGNYSISDLVVTLKNALQAASSLTYTITYSNISMGITITSSSSISLTLSNTKNSLAKMLGFNTILDLSGSEFTSDSTINLSIPLYINICIDGFISSTKSSNPFDNSTFSCATINNNSDILTWTCNSFNNQIVPCTYDNIQMLHVVLKTYNNEPIELNGGNWAMMLKVNYCS